MATFLVFLKTKRHLCICRQRNLSINNTSQDSQSRLLQTRQTKTLILGFSRSTWPQKEVFTWLKVNQNNWLAKFIEPWNGDHEIFFLISDSIFLLISPLTRPSLAQERPHHGGRLHEDMAAMLRLFWSQCWPRSIHIRSQKESWQIRSQW